jgi:hypothetical protein
LLLLSSGIASAQPIVDPQSGAPAPAGPPPEATEERTAFNSIYAELGGSGLYYSVNFDRIVHDLLSVRVGFMYMSITSTATAGSTSASSTATTMAFPILANFIVGSLKHKLEVGAGMDLFYFSNEAKAFGTSASASGFAPWPTGVVGYRLIPGDGGFTFRASFTPTYIPDYGVWWWGGVSFGYAF